MNQIGTTRGNPSSSTVPTRNRCPGSSRNASTSALVSCGMSEQLPVALAGTHLVGGLLEDDLARAHDGAAVDDLQGLAHVLLEQQDGEALVVGEAADRPEDLLHH